MNRIKECRQRRGWNQAELATRLKTGKNTVSRYETGQRQLDPVTINQLCDIFGVTADYLLGRSDMPVPEISAEEWRLLAAWRRSDERARAMVALALEPWAEKEKETAAS